jgi:hypothetical protein
MPIKAVTDGVSGLKFRLFVWSKLSAAVNNSYSIVCIRQGRKLEKHQYK